MKKTIGLKKWVTDNSGVNADSDGIHIYAELYGQNRNGILLYDKKGSAPVVLNFTDEMKTGNTYNCILTGIDPKDYTYLFHEDSVPVLDRRAKALSGHKLFGMEHYAAGEADAVKSCVFVSDSFDWQGDKRLKTPYEDSIYYGMHVRGFTKDASSRMKEAGTFAGVQKKIPYLKKLGVTGIVMQPIYEFEECMMPSEARTASDAVKQAGRMPEMRLNYWGYMPGYYRAPKNAYAYTGDAVKELKTLIRTLHKNGLEIILQFYFDPSVLVRHISDILKYWVQNYHIDGFELLGAALPLKELATEPVLSDTKLWCEGFPYEEIAEIKIKRRKTLSIDNNKRDNSPVPERYLASCNSAYEKTARQFLKGDSNMVSSFLLQQRENTESYGKLNYLAAYKGFRLADMVSYDMKHNEANGEENNDGENQNYSWNCGVEGETRKKNILALRLKQMKNALVMLFTAQGTPFLFMGDEWGKTSGGNNNPYCQDNEVTWLKWNLKKTEKELLHFTEQLIAFRKANGCLHRRDKLQMIDQLSCGYPDLSYHGQEAWRPDMSYYIRHIGMMYCGKYGSRDGKEGDSLYIAYNMHWDKNSFALPKLEKGQEWKLFLDTELSAAAMPSIESSAADTAEETGKNKEQAPAEIQAQSVELPGRSVRIYISEKQRTTNKKSSRTVNGSHNS